MKSERVLPDKGSIHHMMGVCVRLLETLAGWCPMRGKPGARIHSSPLHPLPVRPTTGCDRQHCKMMLNVRIPQVWRLKTQGVREVFRYLTEVKVQISQRRSTLSGVIVMFLEFFRSAEGFFFSKSYQKILLILVLSWRTAHFRMIFIVMLHYNHWFIIVYRGK